jgi:hypothetical protein
MPAGIGGFRGEDFEPVQEQFGWEVCGRADYWLNLDRRFTQS